MTLLLDPTVEASTAVMDWLIGMFAVEKEELLPTSDSFGGLFAVLCVLIAGLSRTGDYRFARLSCLSRLPQNQAK